MILQRRSPLYELLFLHPNFPRGVVFGNLLGSSQEGGIKLMELDILIFVRGYFVGDISF
jgi:hypothetical protein